MNTAGRALYFASALFSFLLSAGVPALASPASALGQELAIVEPKNGFVGRLAVSPPNGPADTAVTVTADRLPPGEVFQLAWRTVIGEWNVSDGEYHGRAFKVVAYEIAKLTSDGAGRATAAFVASFPEEFASLGSGILSMPAPVGNSRQTLISAGVASLAVLRISTLCTRSNRSKVSSLRF